MQYLLFLLLLISCQSTFKFSKVPDVEQCRLLSSSIFCIDPLLNESSFINLQNRVIESDALSDELKQELLIYLSSYKEEIIQLKEYELDFKYINFFKGSVLLSPQNENILKSYMNDRLRILDLYINRYGRRFI